MNILNRKTKFFVFSDVHGNATQLKNSMANAGFDPDDPTHVAISCGDNFDRGCENKEVFKYLQGLKRVILIKGNHEDMLERTLERGTLGISEQMSGLDTTITEFFGSRSIDEYGVIRNDRFISDKLIEFTSSMLDFFETKNYIFVHGWIPVSTKSDVKGRLWETASCRSWQRARLMGWPQMYSLGLTVNGKTIVCGHRSASYGIRFCKEDNRKSQYDPYFDDGIIAIDGFTMISGQVNVVVIEDEWI